MDHLYFLNILMIKAMRKNHIITVCLALFSMAILNSCSKQEQELSDQLKGKWNVSEIRFNSDSLFNDFSKGSHTIEFWGGKKAYTSTFLGVYRIDYIDANTMDVADTFRYDIKSNQLSITSTQTTTVRNLIRYRYKIETLNSSELYLNKTPFDTTSSYLKAIK